MAFGVGPGDEVILPSMTFIACANIVELLGATPIFCDVSDSDLLVSAETIRPHITSRTKAIIVVHLYGQMCDMKNIHSEFSQLGIRILEDCAHSFESNRDQYSPGAYSDAAVFSFYATKNITCGEGGAIITNDDALYNEITQRILHGMTAGAADRFKTGSYVHWNMEMLGIKANLPDILASLLPTQISNLDEKLNMRSFLAQRYDQHFHGLPLRLPSKISNGRNAHHLYPIWIQNNLRDTSLQILANRNIGATVNFRPVNEMNYYKKKYSNNINTTPISSEWGGGVLSLPLYPGLSIQEQDYVIRVVTNEIYELISEEVKYE